MTPDVTSPRRGYDPAWRSRTAHRSLPADIASMLTTHRQALGWTQTQAAQVTGISNTAISRLEHAQRRPSRALAEALIEGYHLHGADAARLRAVALDYVGRSSPYRNGGYVPRFR